MRSAWIIFYFAPCFGPLQSKLLNMRICQFTCCSSIFFFNRSFAPEIKVRSRAKSDRAIWKKDAPTSSILWPRNFSEKLKKLSFQKLKTINFVYYCRKNCYKFNFELSNYWFIIFQPMFFTMGNIDKQQNVWYFLKNSIKVNITGTFNYCMLLV